MVTAFTDLLLAIFCFWCYKSLSKLRIGNTYITQWRLFFLFLCVSTFLGVVVHGLPWEHTSGYYIITWLIMQCIAGVSLFYAQVAACKEEIADVNKHKLFFTISLVQLFVFFACVFYFKNFLVVSVNSLVGLVQLVVLYFPTSIRTRKYKAMIFSGFIISFSTIYIHSKKISLASWFNHNDISHMIMLFSLLFIYFGLKHKYKSAFKYKESLV
ncbi:MAG: hypothetical protein HY841_06730 [Bacteroidetes bacterium]|nr:hypothetical protein [Bacteroidota bacterium]